MNNKRDFIFKAVFFSILLLYSILLLLLLFWALTSSIKTNVDFAELGNSIGLPKDENTREILAPWAWAWGNFKEATKYLTVTGLYRNGRAISVPFGTQLWYTFVYAFGCAAVSTLCPAIMAYATSKFKYGFNAVIDVIVIVTMILPIVGSSVSMISLLHQLQIYDTFLAVYAQKFNFPHMYYLVLAAIFRGIPKDYYEAAYIDGASEWQVMLEIGFPLILNSLGLIYLLFFISYWNDYNTLLYYAPSHPTIIYGLFRIMTDPTGSSTRGELPIQMAGCIIIVVPVIILFAIFKDKVMGNLTIGGVKE
ncbi:MAG: carbohydrate ABC transporter permease [Clostridia bacterium]|nr:carbohydrate ABC transporter permease [Clostridia bacterium]